MSHHGLLPPIFLWHKAAKVTRFNISFFIQCKIACIANIRYIATFLYEFSVCINSCSEFGDLRIVYFRTIKILKNIIVVLQFK